MTRDGAILELNALTVIPITSAIRDIPSQALLTTEGGMMNDCVANVDWIQTLPKGQLSGYITHLSDETLDEVFRAIRFALGFEEI